MSTNRRKRKTLTLDTEGLGDPVVERPQKGHGGRLALPQHQKQMASAVLQTIGPNGVVNAALPDLALQT